MPSESGDQMGVPEAARLLGVEPHTVYRLVETGELAGRVTRRHHEDGRPWQVRTFDLTRQDVLDYIERARIRPGELAHLCRPR